MRPIHGILLIFFLSLLFQNVQALNKCTPPTPLNAFRKPDFMSCLTEIQNLTIDRRRDSGCFDSPEEGILTFDGCELMCGKGIELWEWKDTFNRLSLLVLPTVVLIAHLAFPPLGWHNYLIITLHAVGNPIGSLLSLLTRFEKHRRLHSAAKERFPRQPLVAGAVATVFAAYEELGWHDVSEHFMNLFPGGLGPQEILIITRASHELSSNRLSSTFSASVAIATLVGTLATAIIRTIKQIDENNTRVYIDTAHTIAVVCILFISIPQVWFSARLGTFTTDSGASHIINTMNNSLKDLARGNGGTIFPPIEKLASCPLLPSDRRPNIFLWISKRLPKRLETWLSSRGLSWLEEFFSHCSLPSDNTESSRTLCENEQEKSSNLSINSSWRPCKHLDTRGAHRYNLLISILWVIGGACLPAIFLSATNHIDTRQIAIGCRSLTWTIIMGTWLLSFVSDTILRWLICRWYANPDLVYKIKLIWKWTVYKDAFVTFVVVVLIFVVEIGTYNSCWCRASFSHPAVIDLMPYSPSQWRTAQTLWIALPSSGLVVNFVLIMCIELRWEKWNGKYPRLARQGGSPLCKNRREMKGELEELEKLEKGQREVFELQLLRQESSLPQEDSESQSFLSSTPNFTVQSAQGEDEGR